MDTHWFWWLLTAACLAWYSTITVYVAVRGFADIRRMLARLRALPPGDELHRKVTMKIGSDRCK